MSRSSIKFWTLCLTDLNFYFKMLTEQSLDTIPKTEKQLSRRKTIIRWNYLKKFQLHQGRYWHKLKFTKKHIGAKFGHFSKTRKPFFFRGKKKR